MVGFDDGERISSARLVQVLKPRGGDGRGGEVRGAFRFVLAYLFHEKRFAGFPQLHVNVQRLTIQL